MAEKVSKSSVRYSVGGDHCGACRFFTEGKTEGEGVCEKVAGPIDEDYWCKLFRRRRKTIAHG